jgi:glycosyltransferase involved in cell wall biosynthesis/cellulose synthase/poly-beta-1,6-N-acetylglucosamine synthase-like glycosyltransferase/O-antigen/teichoic acid export membrane protein
MGSRSLIIVLSFLVNPLMALITMVGILSFIYFADIIFNAILVSNSLHSPPEITFTPQELAALPDSKLPIYTILCPLYRESAVLPNFIEAIAKLDWPKDKLDVHLLFEEDDEETIAAAQAMNLPAYYRITVVPHSNPKTKPKACNYGLAQARGEYLVIYDAEDIPDPAQLKKAYLAFAQLPSNVKCLQAKLNYFNPNQNLLTRLFTIEYSLWFDLTLPGLQSFNTMIPLGGTSNHFRTRDLRSLKGWDPFNVTEDCDLGVRLFKNGFKTAIIDSVTLEEANSSWSNWIRQRSRWVKGYMQTFLIHMRHPGRFFRQHGWHALIFQLVVGGKLAFMLINPLMWLLTISYFVLYQFIGSAIEQLYPNIVFYMALSSLVFGNFLFMYVYMIGVARRQQWHLMKYVFLKPFYWIFVSYAAAIALYQLIVKPHYWEKTKHGLHLSPQIQGDPLPGVAPASPRADRPVHTSTITKLWHSQVGAGAVFILAAVSANFLNFVYNAYLGRVLSLSEFGTVTLIGTLLYVAQIFFLSLSRTVSFHSAYLLGKYQTMVKSFWRHTWSWTRWFAFGLTVIWLITLPWLQQFFQLESVVPLLLFTPIWFIGLGFATDSGFLYGQLKFSTLALLIGIEAILKLLFAYFVVELGQTKLVYAATAVSMLMAFMIGRWFIHRLPIVEKQVSQKITRYFPRQYFLISVLNRASSLAYLSLDVLLVKHFLDPDSAGEYGLLSLVGKMVFFVGSLFSSFITPIVAKNEGEQTSSAKPFAVLLGLTVLVTGLAGIVVGPLGYWSLPILFGDKANAIVPYATLYAFGMWSFTVASAISMYYQAKRMYLFPLLSLPIAVMQIAGLAGYHNSISDVVMVMTYTGLLSLVSIVALQIIYPVFLNLRRSGLDFIHLFSSYEPVKPPPNKLKFLIFNWRDTRHAWAGGAEIYVQEIARQWVQEGHHVTMFCGNDGRSPRNEVIEGVQIIRRGGTFSVYFWAVLYYVLRLRGIFDVVIDCENGIPFFSPLYVRKPTFLLIFHVHQKVFREHLRFPLAQIAGFLEARLMPFVYRNQRVLTISESSKQEIISLGLGRPKNVEVIKPGMKAWQFSTSDDTDYPSFVYLGRLKPYKNIDVAITAFAEVVRKYPNAKLTIAGSGESRQSLQKLAETLQISYAVKFVGHVSEEEKMSLLAKSWAALQPSSYEGWGITVIEANACGTPVIASNVSGLKDSILHNRTGILVKNQDVQAFSQAMLRLIEDYQSRMILSRQASRWAKMFSWEDSACRFYANVRTGLQEKYSLATTEQEAYQSIDQTIQLPS